LLRGRASHPPLGKGRSKVGFLSTNLRNFSLNDDLKRLKNLAYHGKSQNFDLVHRFHRLSAKARQRPDFEFLEKLYPWLFVPATLWLIDFDHLIHHEIQRIRLRRRLGKRIRCLISLLGDPPPERSLPLARGVGRQGEKLSKNQSERRDEAARARKVLDEAKVKGLKGKARKDWAIHQMGWPSHTDWRASFDDY